MNIQTKTLWSEAFIKACKTGNLEDVRHLCQKQYLDCGWADIHINDEKGFRWACYHGRLKVVKYLLTSNELKEAGHTFANLHAWDEEGFRVACTHGYLEVVKYLLTSNELKEAGHTFANLHADEEDGFHSGCLSGHLEIVKYLLTSPELIKAGHTWADVHARNDQGFLWACEMGHDNVVRWLVFDYGIKKIPRIQDIIEKYPQAQEYFRVREELHEIQGVLKKTSITHQDNEYKEGESAPKKAKKL